MHSQQEVVSPLCRHLPAARTGLMHAVLSRNHMRRHRTWQRPGSLWRLEPCRQQGKQWGAIFIQQDYTLFGTVKFSDRKDT